MPLSRLPFIIDRTLVCPRPNAYVPRFSPSLHQQIQVPRFNRQVIGQVQVSLDSQADLYLGYRDVVKRVWRLAFPALSYLYNVKQVYPLAQDTLDLLEQTLKSPTLPVPLSLYHDHAEKAAAQHAAVTHVMTQSNGQRIWELIPPNGLSDVVKHYRAAAQALRVQFKKATGRSLDGISALEIGTGLGILPYALAERGAKMSKGIDLSYVPNSSLAHQQFVAEFTAKMPSLTERVELLNMNANHTTFEDASFDLIYSNSVLEHVQELPQNFKEGYRLLKPRGVAIHSVNPYFSPNGGHALVSLDFPWGHTRLNDEQITDYLYQFRPHEAEVAIQFLTEGLTQPHHVLGDYLRLSIEAGFQVLAWKENLLENHRVLLNADILNQTRAHYPHATVNDLLANELILFLQKP